MGPFSEEVAQQALKGIEGKENPTIEDLTNAVVNIQVGAEAPEPNPTPVDRTPTEVQEEAKEESKEQQPVAGEQEPVPQEDIAAAIQDFKAKNKGKDPTAQELGDFMTNEWTPRSVTPPA